VVSFDWNESPSLDMRLPTGTLTLTAQVRDALGALSDIMYSTVLVGPGAGGRRRLLALPYSYSEGASPSYNERERGAYSDYSAGGRRLLMQSSFDWHGAAALLDDELLGGNFDALNNMASALILEVHQSCQLPPCLANCRRIVNPKPSSRSTASTRG